MKDYFRTYKGNRETLQEWLGIFAIISLFIATDGWKIITNIVFIIFGCIYMDEPESKPTKIDYSIMIILVLSVFYLLIV